MAQILNRRELLTRVPPTLATLCALAGLWPQRAHAVPPAVTGKFLLNVHLDGAPDMRHIFAPKPNADATSPACQFWKARSAVYGIGQDLNSWSNTFNALYHPVSFDGVNFGILKEAG